MKEEMHKHLNKIKQYEWTVNELNELKEDTNSRMDSRKMQINSKMK
jgi:hypothetical protein